MSLKQRIDKLHAGVISTVSGQICVYKDGKLIKKTLNGTNKNKVIRIVIKL